jgi:hypothetical protein
MHHKTIRFLLNISALALIVAWGVLFDVWFSEAYTHVSHYFSNTFFTYNQVVHGFVFFFFTTAAFSILPRIFLKYTQQSN